MSLKFTDDQKKVARALLSKPQNQESLREATQLKTADLEEILKLFQQLKLVTLAENKEYALVPQIKEELGRRKHMEEGDDNRFRVGIVLQVQGIEEELVRKQMARVIELIGKEPIYRIYDQHVEDPVKLEGENPAKGEGEYYSSIAELNMSVRDFRALIRLMFFYGPASVEVLKPEKIVFELDDFQNGLVDIGEMVQGYAHYISGMLSRREVEKFNTRWFQPPRGGADSASKPVETLEKPENQF